MPRTKMEARRVPRPALRNEEEDFVPFVTNDFVTAQPREFDRMQDQEEGEERERRRDQEDEETEVLQPLKMYFSPAHNRETTKIASVCFINKAVEEINKLDAEERRWFHEHPQFRHFFHMPLETYHRMQAMSLLTLRAACTEKKKECWFMVNGVPMRYSLREHALMTGMYCHPYPGSLDTLGSMEFVNQHFEGVKKVTYAKVEKKFLSMGRCVERLQMAVLYFVSSVIIGQKRKGVGAPSVEPFFLRAVNDLELCRTFPWGRLAFDANMRDIFHMLDHFNGVPIPHWCFPSFITSLELLPYEAILSLKRACRDEVIGANRECPRMCKMRFKPISMKGWPISELNELLGTSKDIDSILEPTVDEELLLARIMNGLEEEDDAIDPIVDGWKKRIMVERRPIFFEELYKKDVAGRAGEYAEEAEEQEEAENENLPGGTDVPASNAPTTEVPATEGGAETASSVKKIVLEEMEKGFKKIYDHVSNLFGNMDSRVKEVEKFVKERRGDGSEDRVRDRDGVGVGVEDVGGLRVETGDGGDGDGGRGGASEMDVLAEEAEGNGGGLETSEMEVQAEEAEGNGDGLETSEMEVQAEEAEGNGDGLETSEMEVQAEEPEGRKQRYCNGMLVVDDERLLVSGMRCSEVKMVNGRRYKFLNKTEYYPSSQPGVNIVYARNSRERKGGSKKTGGGNVKGKPLFERSSFG